MGGSLLTAARAWFLAPHFVSAIRHAQALQIPRILHQIWMQGEDAVPTNYGDLRETWARVHHSADDDAPWEFKFWDEHAIRALIEDHYGWYLDTYEKLPFLINRADVARYFILHHFGGVYADLDFECVRPFDDLISTGAVIVGEEPIEHARLLYDLESLVSNALLISPPGHPFWPSVVEEIKTEADFGQRDISNMTGPLMLQSAIDKFCNANECDGSVSILPSVFFYPVLDTMNPDVYDTAEDQRRALHNWARHLAGETPWPKETHAIHHWSGSWNNKTVWTQELDRGNELARQGQGLARAMEHFERAMWLGRALSSASIPDALESGFLSFEGFDIYERALSDHAILRSCAMCHAEVGHYLATMGRLADGIGHLERSVQLDAKNALSQFNLGVALKTDGRSSDAVAAFEAAVGESPQWLEARVNLATLMNRRGEHHAALGHFAVAIEIDSSSARAWFGRGSAELGLGSSTNAALSFERSIELDSRPHNPSHRQLRAIGQAAGEL